MSTSKDNELSVGGVLARIDQENLDPALKAIVKNNVISMDQDNNAKISASEMTDGLINAVREASKLRIERDSAKKNLRAASFLSLLLAVAVGVLSFSNFFTAKAAMEAVKDTKFNDGYMVNKDTNEPVATNVNYLSLPLVAIAFLPDDVVAKINDVTVVETLDDGSKTSHHLNVGSISVQKETSFEIKTSLGNVLSWDSEDAERIIATANGSLFDVDVFCSCCSALSVIKTVEIEEQLQKIADLYVPDGSTDADGNRRLYPQEGNPMWWYLGANCRECWM